MIIEVIKRWDYMPGLSVDPATNPMVFMRVDDSLGQRLLDGNIAKRLADNACPTDLVKQRRIELNTKIN